MKKKNTSFFLVIILLMSICLGCDNENTNITEDTVEVILTTDPPPLEIPYYKPIEVKINSKVKGSGIQKFTIYYNLNGKEPDKSLIYTQPITLYKNTVLKAFAETNTETRFPTITKEYTFKIQEVPENLVNINNTLYYQASNLDLVGSNLWKTDGTANGTEMVKNLNPDGFLESAWLTKVGDTLFFVVINDNYDSNLWKSDGTDDGTSIVKDINPDGDSFPLWLTNVDGTLFFLIYNDMYELELWKSDGTTNGTVMVTVMIEDIFIEPTDWDFPVDLAVANNILYFVAPDKEYWDTIWRSDGTKEGTWIVSSKTK